jgi:hypothetical protein
MFFYFFVDYMSWHYSTALVSCIRILKTFWWFVVAYANVPELLRSLFDEYSDTPSTSPYAGLYSIIKRLQGFCMRVLGITGALCALMLVTIGGIIGYGLWLLAPFLAVVFYVGGALLLFTPLLGSI